MPSPSRSSNRESRTVPFDQRKSPSRIIGDGEMADLVRGFDWAGTLLGPVGTWSNTLVTTVNLLLASRHPMFLWWGPELIQFYNDGYRPCIRADKHPSALGQRGIDCWSEIWPIIGPQIEAVMRRGHSTWNLNQLVPINRNGKLEEVYWTYSYSPVRDKDDNVQGTLVVCSETTEQVLSERRQRTLLAITSESGAHRPSPSQPLLPFAQTIVRKLEDDLPDIPFASLYLLSHGEVRTAGSTASDPGLSDPDRWPLADVMNGQIPMLVDDLQERFGQVVCQPWPAPVTRAYLLPVHIAGSSVQAILIFGISARLPFDDGYQTFFQLVASRIGGLLQSEVHRRELAEAAKRFSRLAEANPFGMVIGGLHGELKYANPAFLNTLGYTEADVASGKVHWDTITPPEYAELDAHAIRQLLASGRCEVYEKAYIASDGRRVPILLGASIIDSEGRDPEIAAFVTDLTPLKIAQEALRKANDDLEKKVAERTAALEAQILDRKRAEISLRELAGRLLLTQDEERRRMARELHDHAGQTLVALGMNLSALQAAAQGREAKLVDLAVESKQLSDGLSKEIRTLSYLLHPPLLDEVGLVSALQWYVEGFSQRSKIKVELELPPDLGRLPDELELVIFRVIQESLTNVHRHSGTSSARIRLTRSKNAVEFEIDDRGKGISRERLQELTTAKIGVGVRGMEERVRQFRGTLRITSDGEGTKVSVMIPVPSDAS